MTDRYTNQTIIDAYKETGSVWAAGKMLGMAGQSVHGRLRALDYPLANRKWSEAEIEELRALAGHEAIGVIAHRLGRPYAGVACKLSELGVAARTRHTRLKIPRGAGYDKASCAKYIKQIDAGDMKVTVFARRNTLGVEMLCKALERHFPEWWADYRRAHSDLPERTCPYCEQTFVPATARQRFCSRKCGNDARTDRIYFGGNRRKTIGLLEGICQLCGREGHKGLTPHHALGKENDPGDDYLVALCMGCHQLVTLLAPRSFLDEPHGWEALISLVQLRSHPETHRDDRVFVCVDIGTWAEEMGEQA